MDKLKSSQKVIRNSFTKAYNAFQAEKQKLSPNLIRLQTQFALIRDKAIEFSELSHKTQDEIFNASEQEETLTKEVKTADEYATKYHQAKIELSDLMEVKLIPIPPPPS